MYEKFSRLSFVIGLFFTIVSVILFVNTLLSRTDIGLALYTATVFLVFGLVMMFLKNKNADEHG